MLTNIEPVCSYVKQWENIDGIKVLKIDNELYLQHILINDTKNLVYFKDSSIFVLKYY